MEFKQVKLGELSIDGKGSYGIAASAVDFNEELPTYLRITDISEDGNLLINSLKSVDEPNAKNYSLKPNDIVFARTGNSTGKSYFYDGSDGELIYAGFLIKFSLDESKVNPKFIRYYTLSEEYKGWVKGFSTGSTRGNINAKSYANMQIDLPPRKYQNFVVDILSSLENKIKLNNSIILNLEQLSQTLFKHWFIDFEFPNEQGQPYKSSGGEMVESELGEIPKGWKISTLGTLIQNTIGGDWGKETSQGNYIEKVSIIRGADLPELKAGRDGKVPTRYILNKNYSNKKLKAGDIIIEISGGSPTQSTGRTLYINQEIINKYQDKVLCTNFCRTLRPLKIEHGLWIESYIMYLYEMNLFFNFENGTTGIKNLDLNAVLNNYKIVIPAEETLELFSKQFEILNSSIQEKGKENRKLAELRDNLLPKLLSGEIEIPDEMEVK